MTGHGEAPIGYNHSRDGNYGYNRSIVPTHCHDHAGRWCGLEGTIVDMLQHGVTIDQVVPAVWMARCFPNGTMTLTGWTQPKLRAFLAFAGAKGCARALRCVRAHNPALMMTVSLCACVLCRVEQVAVWTDGAMSQAPWGPGGGNPELSTCGWFVPELLRWVNGDTHDLTKP